MKKRFNVTLDEMVYEEFIILAERKGVKFSTWVNSEMQHFIEENNDKEIKTALDLKLKTKEIRSRTIFDECMLGCENESDKGNYSYETWLCKDSNDPKDKVYTEEEKNMLVISLEKLGFNVDESETRSSFMGGANSLGGSKNSSYWLIKISWE